jgi:hypothetical protein
MPHSIDVSELSPEAIRAIEALVGLLKEKAQREGGQGSTSPLAGDAAAAWRAAAEAVQGLSDYDFGAWQEQRALDRQRAGDHLK